VNEPVCRLICQRSSCSAHQPLHGPMFQSSESQAPSSKLRVPSSEFEAASSKQQDPPARVLSDNEANWQRSNRATVRCDNEANFQRTNRSTLEFENEANSQRTNRSVVRCDKEANFQLTNCSASHDVTRKPICNEATAPQSDATTKPNFRRCENEANF
jgi:hypothetical protein